MSLKNNCHWSFSNNNLYFFLRTLNLIWMFSILELSISSRSINACHTSTQSPQQSSSVITMLWEKRTVSSATLHSCKTWPRRFTSTVPWDNMTTWCKVKFIIWCGSCRDKFRASNNIRCYIDSFIRHFYVILSNEWSLKLRLELAKHEKKSRQ